MSDGKITQLPLLSVLNNSELMEVVHQLPNGKYDNYKLPLTSIRGADGLSAYQVAVANGYQGTEQAWLQSLKGKSAYTLAVELGFQGTEEEWIESLKGKDGVNGTNGKSAYELAVELGYQGTEAEWLESLKGKSAYQIAVDLGFVGTDEEWIESLRGAQGPIGPQGPEGPKGADGLPGANGESAYQAAVDEGFSGTKQEWLASLKGADGKTAYESAVEGGYTGTEEEFYQQLAEPNGVSGAVFITDITPQQSNENVGDKVKTADGYSLLTATTTTKLVKVSLTGITGYSSYVPNITVNDVPVTMTLNQNAPMWKGEVNLTLPDPVDGKIEVKAVHQDGAKFTTVLTTDTPPNILTGVFNSTYPGTQTELKAGDVMSVILTTDTEVVGYEMRDVGAFVSSTGTFAATKTVNLNNLVIANRGNTTQLLPFEVRVKKETGSFSAWFNSGTAGNAELVNVVKLNNLRPTIAFGTISYPNGQGAIKVGEKANVPVTVNNATSVSYTTLNDQLTVTNPSVLEPVKEVTYKNGVYNDSTNNFNVTAIRAANNSTASANTVVKIANTIPVVNVTLPFARLRSGGNFGTDIQKYTVTITSDQALLEAPSMNLPTGVWDSLPWTPDATRKIWTRAILVNDNDPKGTYSYNSISIKGLAGLVQTSISSGGTYTFGGFVFRTLAVSAYPNRETPIGTDVVTTAKLRCSNLSKGGSGSLNTQYQATTDNAVDRYTIINNNTWYNCDAANAVSNTTGSMLIEIEEVV